MFGRALMPDAPYGDYCTCGIPHDPGDVFCMRCGKKIPQGGSDVPQGEVCAVCGAPCQAGDAFCMNCGNPITPGGGGPVEGDYCTCGIPHDPGDVFCMRCGKKINFSKGGPFSEDDPMSKEYCTCGASHKPGDVYCEICGKPVPVKTNINDMPTEGRILFHMEGVTEEDDDDPTMLTKLVTVSPEVARSGGRIDVETQDGLLSVNLIPGITSSTKVDIEGYGLRDERTGVRGVLRLSFYIS